MKQYDVIIVGGGFGGLYAAKKQITAGKSVLLISTTDYFTFTPLLIDAFSGELPCSAASFNFYDFLRHRNFSFVCDTVTHVDADRRSVTTPAGTYQGEYIVLAPGSIDRPMAIDGSEHTLHFKTLSDVRRAQQIFLEKLEQTDKPFEVSIIGAGVTGIEIAFAVKELACRVGKRQQVRLRLFNDTDTLLPLFSARTRAYLSYRFDVEGIQVHAQTAITKITSSQVHAGGQIFNSQMTFFAAGVVPNTGMLNPSMLDARGYVVVNEFLQLVHHERIFAIGDSVTLRQWNIPKLAQTAVVQGKHVASNIVRHARRKKMVPYRPKILGRVLSLGKWHAAVEIHGFVFTGLFAYGARSGTYVFKMPGLRYKIRVLTTWVVRTLHRSNFL